MKRPREYVSSKEIKKIKEAENTRIKGSFLIGYINKDTGKFRPRYLGVSYTELMREIVASSKLEENKTFDRYRLVKTNTNQEAWELECKTYHEFKEINNLTNKRHSKWPKETESTILKCPFQDCQF
jgi:hypothetical protein